MRSAALIYNPYAGRGRASRRVPQLLAELGAGGYSTEALATSGPGAATDLARAAGVAGLDAVFAFGGDGTLREVAAGLLGSATALGFIPGGTVNVMTLTLGLPRRPDAAAAALSRAQVREIDVGLCGDEVFLMQASAGVDAELIRRLRTPLKRWVAVGAAVPAGLGALTFYRYPRIALTADGEALEGSLAVVSNICFYGGPFRIQPDARCDDRKLDLVVFRGRGRAATTGFARDLLLGRHLRRRDVVARQVDRVELHGPPELPIQIDGDVFANRPPVSIRLAPARLRVLMA